MPASTDPAPIVVVGGGLAAGTVVTELREGGYDGPLAVYADEAHPPYERPPLSKDYLLDKGELSAALVHPEDWYVTHRVDLHTSTPVTAIDPAAHTYTAAGRTSPYRALVLATGSRARRLAMADDSGADVHYLRQWGDAERLRAALTPGSRLVMIGGGWIGLEVASAARAHDVEVVLLEAAAQPLLPVLGDQVAALFADLHRAHGVDLRTGSQVSAIRSTGSGVEVDVESGGTADTVTGDHLVVGIGAIPDVALAEAAGLTVENGVRTDARLRTSAEDVYAAGDIAHADHPVLGHPLRVEHWDTAIQHGKVVAQNLLGHETRHEALPYFFTDQYDLGMEYVGNPGPEGFDRVVVRGRTGGDDGGQFTAWWLRDSMGGRGHARQRLGRHRRRAPDRRHRPRRRSAGRRGSDPGRSLTRGPPKVTVRHPGETRRDALLPPGHLSLRVAKLSRLTRMRRSMSALPPHRSHGRRARKVAGTLAAAAVVLTTALASTSLASATTTGRSIKPGTPERTGSPATEARGFYDARYGKSGTAKATTYRSASRAYGRGATKALAQSITGKAVFDIDGTTGTVRSLARLDGFLTGKSNKPAEKVALSYVKSNHSALGLTNADLNTFKLKRDYVDIQGTHHLYWIQRVGGKNVFGNGLTAAVTKDGHLLMVGGSPVSKAHLPAPADPEIASPSAAVADARVRLGATDNVASSSDSAELVLFVTPRGTYNGWLTTVMSVAHPATQVVDAASGRLLYRNPLGDDASGEGIANVFNNYPSAPRGGATTSVNLTRKGWLPHGATKLSGNNAHAYSDVNDDNTANPSEEVHPTSGGVFNKKLVPFKIKGMQFCQQLPCSWDPDKPFSWKTNRAQAAAQVFYFVNKFHDHLLAKPVGFTEAAGNFENTNSTGKGKGHDALEAQSAGRRQHRQRPARQRPRRQRQHEHASGRHAADDADVPAAPARRVVPRRGPLPGEPHR